MSLEAIPSDANWFYVSDSFTLLLNQPGPAPFTQYFQPGPANQSGVISANQTVRVYIKSCSIVSLPISYNQSQGINTDLFVGLYKIDQTPWVWQNRMPFAAPYGTADNGLIANQVSKVSDNTPRAWREFGTDTPLVLGQTSGPGQYLIGAGFQFNFGAGPILIQYEYHIHGAWKVVP